MPPKHNGTQPNLSRLVYGRAGKVWINRVAAELMSQESVVLSLSNHLVTQSRAASNMPTLVGEKTKADNV
jgi:hypothetical protein